MLTAEDLLNEDAEDIAASFLPSAAGALKRDTVSKKACNRRTKSGKQKPRPRQNVHAEKQLVPDVLRRRRVEATCRGFRFYVIYYLLCIIYYLLFTSSLFSIYYLLFTIYYLCIS